MEKLKLGTVWLLAIPFVQAVCALILPFVWWPEMLNWPFFINNGWSVYKDILIVHTPLLLFVLSVAYRIFGYQAGVLQMVGIILLFLSNLLIGTIVFRLTKSSKLAVFGSCLFLILSFAFEGNHVWFESLVMPLLLSVFYFQWEYFQVKQAKYLFVSGVFLGLAMLTKQTVAYVLPAVGIVFLVFNYHAKHRWIESLKEFVILTFPSIAIILVFLFSLWRIGLLGDFYYFAVKFVFFKPFVADGLNSYLLFPNKRQLFILVILVATAGYAVIKRKKPLDYALFFWFFFSIFFAFPRFEYWHLLPAIGFYCILLGVCFDRLASFAKVALIFTIFILAGALIRKNLIYTHTFLEPEIVYAASYLKNNYSHESVYILNGPDQLYFLIGKTPGVKPWIPQLPWVIPFYGQERMVADIRQSFPDIIIYQEYLTKPVAGLGSWRPHGVLEYFKNNYVFKENLPGNIQVWERL